MCEGEFESLKAIYAVSPRFVPKPFAWDKYEKTDKMNQDIHFLLAEFRHVGQQPADPVKLGIRLADMQQRSVSRTVRISRDNLPRKDRASSQSIPEKILGACSTRSILAMS